MGPERVEETKTTAERLSETETAKHLGVSRGTLANWRWRRYGLRYLKIGRRVEYRLSDIEDWANAQTHDPSEAAAS